MFTLRDDEADERMSELHEQFCARRLAVAAIGQKANVAAHHLVKFLAAEHVKAGNLVTIKGNVITVTKPLVGTCNVSIGVAPHA